MNNQEGYKILIDEVWDRKMLTQRVYLVCTFLIMVLLMDRLFIKDLEILIESDGVYSMGIEVLGLFLYLLFFAVLILYGLIMVYKTIKGLSGDGISYVTLSDNGVEYRTKLTYLVKRINRADIVKFLLVTKKEEELLVVYKRLRLKSPLTRITLKLKEGQSSKIRSQLRSLGEQGLPILYIEEIVKNRDK